jgi:hypothetical protein
MTLGNMHEQGVHHLMAMPEHFFSFARAGIA